MEFHNKSQKGGAVMAITEVTASLNSNTITLQENLENEYSGYLIAPEETGTYMATVSAYDEDGNVTNVSRSVTVSAFVEPKVNWTVNDRFNIQDYNRIKNNLEYLYERAIQILSYFEIFGMGTNITEYSGFWSVEKFNLFETNLDLLNEKILSRDFGTKQVFFENGPFIGYEELNRIESAILDMKESLDNLYSGLRRIPFRLGSFRNIRV